MSQIFLHATKIEIGVLRKTGAMQCLGRHTKEKKNIPELKFSNKPRFGFFLPAQCTNTRNENEEICSQCEKRRQRIPELLEKWKGTMQNQSEQLHGIVTGPIPEWSRVYNSPYYLAKIASGWTIDEETEHKALSGSVNSMQGDNDSNTQRVLESLPLAPSAKKVLKSTKLAQETPAPKKFVKVKKEASPEAPPEAPPPLRKKPIKIKNELQTPATPKIITSEEAKVVPPPRIIKIREITVDDRVFYLGIEKNSVYDMKFNYIGTYDHISKQIIN